MAWSAEQAAPKPKKRCLQPPGAAGSATSWVQGLPSSHPFAGVPFKSAVTQFDEAGESLQMQLAPWQ
jgi:hypothetical protein